MASTGRGVAGEERRFSDLNVFVGDLSIDETKVTSTAAELNILDGVTSTAAELNILDGVTATAAELNNAADVSARVEEHTGAGAVTAGIQSVEINSVAAAALTIASADAHQGLFIVKHTSSSDGQNHTLTLTSGTYDGTNTVALLDAANEALVVYFDSNGDGTIVENVGSVSLG